MAARFLVLGRPGGGTVNVLATEIAMVVGEAHHPDECAITLKGGGVHHRVKEPAGEVVRSVERVLNERLT